MNVQDFLRVENVELTMKAFFPNGQVKSCVTPDQERAPFFEHGDSFVGPPPSNRPLSKGMAMRGRIRSVRIPYIVGTSSSFSASPAPRRDKSFH